MTYTPEQVQALQARIDADRDVQAVLRGPLSTYDKLKAFSETMKRKGLDLPDGLTVDIKTGRIKEDHFWREVGLGTLGLAGSAVGAQSLAPHPSTPAPPAPTQPAPTPPSAPGDVPTIPSHPVTDGMGTDPTLGMGGRTFDLPGGASDIANSVIRRATGNGGDPASGGMDTAKLIAAFAALIPGLMAGRQTDADKALTGTQNDILNLQKKRMESQQPLFDSAQRGLMGMLPTWMRGGQ